MDNKDVTNYMKSIVGSINLNDPKSNYYRVLKQLLLIEEHCAVKPLNCRFCCFKHATTAVALLDEISQLDGRQLYSTLNTQLHGMLDNLPWRFVVNDGKGPTTQEYELILKDVRVARKYLMDMYFFPKSVEPNTVAATSGVSVSTTGTNTMSKPSTLINVSGYSYMGAGTTQYHPAQWSQ